MSVMLQRAARGDRLDSPAPPEVVFPATLGPLIHVPPLGPRTGEGDPASRAARTQSTSLERGVPHYNMRNVARAREIQKMQRDQEQQQQQQQEFNATLDIDELYSVD